jgi:UDP-N-acetylmuramyl pentapeptide synthase
MTFLLTIIMTALARCYLWRHRPGIVAVTGNAGKTSTREAIAAVLATNYRVRSPGANLNTPLGTAATIVGAPMEIYERQGGTAGFWLRAVMAGIRHLIFDSRAPQIIVLEYGADAPGDIARLVRLFPPHVSVVTQVGEVPVHVEFFASALHLANEKMQIIKHLKTTDHAVLNYDDQTVLDMRTHTKARVHTFGMGDGADVRALQVSPRIGGTVPLGITFDIAVAGHAMPVAINGTLGRGVASASAVAVAVGRMYGIGLADMVQALCHMRPPAGRMRILRGIKDTTIIDDTYNASPAAMHLALDTVRSLPASRKIIVIGDMLELGKHSIQAHQSIGDMAGDIATVLVCVGERARFYADAASDQMPKENIHWFHDSLQAAPVVQSLMRQGDLVLVKGSQGKRMERIVKEIMAEPERASELLARQSARWLAK